MQFWVSFQPSLQCWPCWLLQPLQGQTCLWLQERGWWRKAAPGSCPAWPPSLPPSHSHLARCEGAASVEADSDFACKKRCWGQMATHRHTGGGKGGGSQWKFYFFQAPGQREQRTPRHQLHQAADSGPAPDAPFSFPQRSSRGSKHDPNLGWTPQHVHTRVPGKGKARRFCKACSSCPVVPSYHVPASQDDSQLGPFTPGDRPLYSVTEWRLSLLVESHPRNGHVLREDGQPLPLRLPPDTLCQPADALCRSLRGLLHQFPVLPFQLPLPGTPHPGKLCQSQIT